MKAAVYYANGGPDVLKYEEAEKQPKAEETQAFHDSGAIARPIKTAGKAHTPTR